METVWSTSFRGEIMYYYQITSDDYECDSHLVMAHKIRFSKSEIAKMVMDATAIEELEEESINSLIENENETFLDYFKKQGFEIVKPFSEVSFDCEATHTNIVNRYNTYYKEKE